MRARSLAPVESLGPPAAGPPWPETEIWAFAADPSLRVVEVEGVPAVDPQQTTLPDSWRHFPAYALVQDSAMALVEKRRGDADPAPDELALERTLWLDFAGTGYTFHDRISGRLSRSWRLDMPLPSSLGRVAVDGVDQLIGRVSADSAPGVELRQSQAAIEADGRIDGLLRELPAVSWDHDFVRVAATLQLPPGWRLLHVGGADTVSETWIRSWSLLDLFLVLVIALAIGRLRSRAWGVVALVSLALLWPEPGAPRYAWLALLGAHALVRVLPEGRMRSLLVAVRLAALVLVAAIAIPFAIMQVRTAVYPALEERDAFDVSRRSRAGGAAGARDGRGEVRRADGGRARAGAAGPRPRARQARVERAAAQARALELLRARARRARLDRAGAAVVELAQRSPLVERTRRALAGDPSLAGVAGGELRARLAARRAPDRAARRRRGLRRPLRRAGCARGARAAAALALLAFLLAPAGGARADDFPPADLLEQLRTRMLELPSCAPSCAESPRMRLEIDAERMRARIEIAVAARSAVPLARRRVRLEPRAGERRRRGRDARSRATAKACCGSSSSPASTRWCWRVRFPSARPSSCRCRCDRTASRPSCPAGSCTACTTTDARTRACSSRGSRARATRAAASSSPVSCRRSFASSERSRSGSCGRSRRASCA